LLEIERERTANTRLQRDADAASQRATRSEESARAEIQALQKQLGDSRHQAGMLEGRLDAMRANQETQAREREAAQQQGAGANTTTARRTTGRAGRPAADAAKPLRPARKTAKKA
jgi:hypothetical protein